MLRLPAELSGCTRPARKAPQLPPPAPGLPPRMSGPREARAGARIRRDVSRCVAAAVQREHSQPRPGPPSCVCGRGSKLPSGGGSKNLRDHNVDLERTVLRFGQYGQ
eukprot:364962-Chlamydomonas_euryale.AAC.2